MSAATFNAETWLPANRRRFRLDELAEFLSVSVNHLFNLITARELHVPRLAIKAAPSRGSILVSRKAAVAFVNSRRSSERLKRRAKRSQSPANAPRVPARDSESKRETRKLCNRVATRRQCSK
jgi:3'-phosphoadenosine 5'-phosphosulfate (PAPS) 3'-phosphatase